MKVSEHCLFLHIELLYVISFEFSVYDYNINLYIYMIYVYLAMRFQEHQIPLHTCPWNVQIRYVIIIKLVPCHEPGLNQRPGITCVSKDYKKNSGGTGVRTLAPESQLTPSRILHVEGLLHVPARQFHSSRLLSKTPRNLRLASSSQICCANGRYWNH